MHYHFNNENRLGNKIIGSILFAGRSWFYFKKRQLNLEWYFFHRARSSLSMGIDWGSGDGDDGITFHASIPYLFSIYISLTNIFGSLFRYPRHPRETGITFFEGCFHINILSTKDIWNSKDPWYKSTIFFNIKDLLLGKNKYSEENDSGWNNIEITMPEGKYMGKCRLYIGKWKNRFKTKYLNKGEIILDKGIPFPGKGENAWDCGETCTYSITCNAKNEEDVICELIRHILQSRRRYGSREMLFNYKPEKEYPSNL